MVPLSNTSSQKISTVFIIDDDEALCEALSYLISSININVEKFLNGYDFINKYDPQRQGCILTDIRMPEISGLELQTQLKSLANQLPIIFMSGFADVTIAVQAMREGAFDFIIKPFNNQLLLEVIQKAIKYNLTCQELNVDAINNYKNLTKREAQVLEKIVDGKLNKEIAFELDITLSTVEMHRANLMRKMKCTSVAQLIKNYLGIKFNMNLLHNL
jgi:FixJ family two-component response regulator